MRTNVSVLHNDKILTTNKRPTVGKDNYYGMEVHTGGDFNASVCKCIQKNALIYLYRPSGQSTRYW